MPSFYYRAIDRSGKLSDGTIAADSVEALRHRLSDDHQFLIEVSEAKRPLEVPIVTGTRGTLFQAGVSDRELAVLAWQLHTMLGAGLAVLRSLELLSRQTHNSSLRAALDGVCKEVSRGDDFSAAISRRPDVFPALFASMAETGELAGTLDNTMRRLAEHLDRVCDLRDKLVGALAYPVLLLGLSIVVSTFLLIFVLPRLTAVFAESGVPLPLLTRVLVTLAYAVSSHWLMLCALIAAGVWILRSLARTQLGRQWLHTWILQAPVIGPLVLKSLMMQVTQTLATLQASGISLTASLALIARNMRNVVLANLLHRMQSSVVAGETLSSELAKSPIVPELVTTMVAVGEETGTLPEMLRRVADVYVKEVEASIGAFTRLIEPLLLVGLTVVVGLIAAGIYLPIADLSSAVAR